MVCPGCAIKNLVYRYDGDMVMGTDAGPDRVLTGAAAIGAMYRDFTRIYDDDSSPHTMHMTSNVMVEVADDGAKASASSYAVVFQAVDGFPLQPIIGVRYSDRFERTARGWYFTWRRIEPRLVGDLSHHLLRPA